MKKKEKQSRNIRNGINLKLTASVLFSFLFIILASASSLATLDVALSDQGSGVTTIATGELVDEGDLTVAIYDSLTGGTLIYSETFSNVIDDGSWNVMLGEDTSNLLSLEYGKKYFKDYTINGEDVSFIDFNGDPVARSFFIHLLVM